MGHLFKVRLKGPTPCVWWVGKQFSLWAIAEIKKYKPTRSRASINWVVGIEALFLLV